MADQNALSLEEFKARLPIAEIVGRYVRLIRRGREFTGLCPFHQEKSPSFTISEEKGFYHCFGCNQHGNAVDFIMAVEGLDFSQAIMRLSDLTGLSPPARAGKKTSEAEKTLVHANDAAAKWFAGCLAGPQGREASAYLERRGLDAACAVRQHIADLLRHPLRRREQTRIPCTPQQSQPDRDRLNFLGGEHERRQVETGTQDIANARLALDGDTLALKRGNIAIDRALCHLQPAR
jgi:DNA primase